ncbi:MAG: cohesin domain-containing protein [Patescibacteria group bacterium]|nr:cohesin domain-containing protein [Patescibacteria group bacterium]
MKLKPVLFLIIIFTFTLLAHPGKTCAQTASLSFEPNTITAIGNEDVVITVYLDTNSTETNTITVDIDYDPKILEVTELDTQNSVFESSAEEDFGNGNILLTRFMSPGNLFKGKGELLKVKFRILQETASTVRFGDKTLVLDTSANSLDLSSGTLSINDEVGNVTDIVIDKDNSYLIILAVVFVVVILLVAYLLSRKRKGQFAQQG